MSEEHRREMEELRKKLDEVDDAILRSLADRAGVAKRVAILRQQDPDLQSSSSRTGQREREIIERIEARGAGEFPKRALAPVFREVLSACRALESPLRVAYEGAPGSPAHEAARKRFGASAEYLPCEGAGAAIELVSRDHADLAVIMLESSKEGLLQPALDALTEGDLRVIEEIETDAKIHILNVTGNLQAVEKLYTAPAERAAAARFLSTNLPRAQIYDTRTPAMAAELAAVDHGAAALGSNTIGEMFGLLVARGNVSDVQGEHVRCAVLSARPAQRTGHDTTAVAISLDDSPGALFRALKPLADKDLNLRRIQSRPRGHGEAPGEGRTYRFFFEVAGHVTDRPLVTALDEMKRSVRLLKILGSYPSKT